MSEEQKTKLLEDKRNFEKEKYDNLSEEQKVRLLEDKRNFEKAKYDNLPEEEKDALNAEKTSQKRISRNTKKQTRKEIFGEVKDMSMTDPAILNTEAYKLIKKEYELATNIGPIYICDICWKFEYRASVIILDPNNYNNDLYVKCKSYSEKSNYICKKCARKLRKGKIPDEAQANNMQFCPLYEELGISSSSIYVYCSTI